MFEADRWASSLVPCALPQVGHSWLSMSSVSLDELAADIVCERLVEEWHMLAEQV